MILQSEQLDQLFTALAKAQGEFGLAEQDGWNPYNYGNNISFVCCRIINNRFY